MELVGCARRWGQPRNLIALSLGTCADGFERGRLARPGGPLYGLNLILIGKDPVHGSALVFVQLVKMPVDIIQRFGSGNWFVLALTLLHPIDVGLFQGQRLFGGIGPRWAIGSG